MGFKYLELLPRIRGTAKPLPLPPLPPRNSSDRLGINRETGGAVALSPEERQAHTHILGGSGRGKSYFLQHLLRQDFANPDCGLCLLDPHGSLYTPLVRYLAAEHPELAERVVLFDPVGSAGYIPGYNPIGSYALEFPEYTLNTLVSACLKAWGQDKLEHTPRITRQLQNIFAPIIVNGLTMIETAPMISTARHAEKRALLLSTLEHDGIRDEWAEFEAATSTQRQQLLEGAGNRLRRFLGNRALRRIFGRQEKVIDIDRIVAEKKILLVNLAPGMELDRENANLLGILLINELFRSAMLRNPDTNPHPFYLYIDEFAQLITPSMAHILDECRKFGLFLILAHQHLAQLKKEDDWLVASVLANCHNRFVFGGLSFEDAELLERQVYTGFTEMKQIKHTEWQTKFRPVEEERVVRSKSRNRNLGWSEMFTETAGTGTARTRSIANAIGHSRGRSLGRSESAGEQMSLGNSLTFTHQDGGQQGVSFGHQLGHTANSTWSDGVTNQHGTASSNTITDQQSTQRSYPPSGDSSRALTESDGTALGTQTSQMQGFTHQHGGSEGRSETESKQISAGRNWSDSQARGMSRQSGINRNRGRSLTDTETNSTTRTLTAGITESEQRQKSHGRGRSGSEGEGESESVVPFHRMEEFQEAKHTFWSQQELQLMRTGAMKELPIGSAVAKIGAAPPIPLQVDLLDTSPYEAGKTEAEVAAFARRVVAAAPQYYATLEEAQDEINRRQLAIFGEVMQMELRAVNQTAPTEVTVPRAIPVPPVTEVPSRTPPDGAVRFTDDDDES